MTPATWAVAWDESTPASVLAQLATNQNWIPRTYVAGNPSTPPDALRQLATDDDRYVRLHVAQNPQTPVDALTQLAADEDSVVRFCVTHHPSLPLNSDAFLDLMIDPDEIVRAETMERLAKHLAGCSIPLAEKKR